MLNDSILPALTATESAAVRRVRRLEMLDTETGCPVLFDSPVNFVLMPGVHCQQISNSHCFQVPGNFCRRIFRKELQDTVVETQLAIFNSQSDSRRSEALAQ